MDVFEFFHQISRQCDDRECERCEARELCYTAPANVTDEMIQKTIDCINLACAADKHVESISTAALVKELSHRKGVKAVVVAPYEDINIACTGPVIVLMVED